MNDISILAGTTYVRRRHAAVRTTDFVFNQLIPYIGNKRKLLDLIAQALKHTTTSEEPTFLDIFAGSGVVSRLAKTLGYRVIANDWEPYAKVINGCYITNNEPPAFARFGGYERTLDLLNELPPRIDWITEHLCPRDDENYDIEVDRMFYMRKNGMRIDAIRHQILDWQMSGALTDAEQDCLLAPLLFQACYSSNTSGVFKGFHNGWGGQTKTALYRIAGDLCMTPAVFHDNGMDNQVLCDDAQRVTARKVNQGPKPRLSASLRASLHLSRSLGRELATGKASPGEASPCPQCGQFTCHQSCHQSTNLFFTNLFIRK